MRDLTGQARPVDTGTLALTTLPTSPFWARRYTRLFLDSCQEISPDMAETSELIVSELVTNAVRYAGEPAGITQQPHRTAVSLIALSLRNFSEVLLIEVYDTDSNPPILSSVDDSAENGRPIKRHAPSARDGRCQLSRIRFQDSHP